MGAILRARDKDGNVYDIPAIRGARGPQGPKGDTGSGFKVLDYYDTLEALEAAVTAPSAGDAYGVGTAAPYDIYIYSMTQGWVNNGPIKGAQGQEGPAGADGVSPSVSVSEIAGGHRVSIQDAGGTRIFDVKDGAGGQDGAAGADGITPTIGDNGNWYLGEADTGKPSRGETGPAGPQGETGQTGPRGPKGDVGKPSAIQVILAADGWDEAELTQTVTADGVLADETAQLILPVPAIASRSEYVAAGVLCTNQAADRLTFTCSSIPTASLTVYVTMQEVSMG